MKMEMRNGLSSGTAFLDDQSNPSPLNASNNRSVTDLENRKNSCISALGKLKQLLTCIRGITRECPLKMGELL